MQRPWRAEADGIVLSVRVTPRSVRDAVGPIHTAPDGAEFVAVKVRAMAEGGLANEAVRRCVANALGRPVSAVSLRAGATARFKTIAVAGEVPALEAILAGLCGVG